MGTTGWMSAVCPLLIGVPPVHYWPGTGSGHTLYLGKGIVNTYVLAVKVCVMLAQLVRYISDCQPDGGGGGVPGLSYRPG